MPFASLHARAASAATAVALTLALTATLTPARAATAQPHLWKTVQIRGGGFVSGIVFHPTQPNLVYARTDVGGAFRWDQPSTLWIPITDSLGKNDSQLTGIVSLALDPSDPNRVYLAAGQYLASWAVNAAILRSSDQGATWSRTSLSVKLGGNSDGRSTGERLQVDPNKGSILFLGTNQDGLWKSADSGATFTRVTTFAPTSLTLLLFDPRSGTTGSATPTIYAGVNTTTSSLLRSTDAGATWSAVPGQPSGLMPHHADFDPAGILYLTYANALGPNGVTTGAVWKFNPATQAWTNISPPSGQGGFAGLSIDRQRPGTLVVSTLDRWSPRDEIFRSTNAGTTWTSLLSSSTWDTSSAPYAKTSTPHWIGDIDIDPFDSNRATFITGYGLFTSTNLADTTPGTRTHWIFNNTGLEETVPLAIASPPAGPALLSAIGDIDGFRHADVDTPSFYGRHTPAHGTNTSIDFAQQRPHLIVRTHNTGNRGALSSDHGATWTDFASAPATAIANGANAIAIAADGTRLLWCPTSSRAYVSTDAGKTWTLSAGSPLKTGESFLPVADRVNPLRFYIHDHTTGILYRSTDGGASFKTAATGLPTGPSELASLPPAPGESPTPSNLWLAIVGKGLFRSTNAGTTFAKIATVQDAYIVGFGQPPPGKLHPSVFIWGSVDFVFGVYRSDDIGRSWLRVTDPLHQFGWINALTGDPRRHGRVYLATGGRGIVYGDIDPNPPATEPPGNGNSSTRTLYDDGLATGWLNWSWAVNDFASTTPAPVHGGTNAISATPAAWTALYFHTDAPIDTAPHTVLSFWINGGSSGGQQLRVSAHLAGISQAEVLVPALAKNTWVKIAIPLTTLGVANKTNLDGFWIQDRTGTSQPVFYVDDVQFE